MDEELQAEMPAPDAIAPEKEVADSSPAVETPVVETPKEPEDQAVRGVQKRIDELTWKVREAERREAAYLKALENRAPEKAPEPVRTDPVAAKTLADFGFDEAQYQKHVYEQAALQAETLVERKFKEREEAQKAEARGKSFTERESKFASDHDDYLTITRDPSLPVSQAMVEIIAESEDGPALAYHLAKNRALAEAISKLPPVQAARELGRLEARIAVEKAAPPKVSTAPPPPPKIESTGEAPSVRTTDSSGDALPDADWFAMELKRTRKKR